MARRLLTASPTDRLLSVAAARAYLGLGSDTSKDATIAALQSAISSAFAEYLGFPLQRQRYEETVPGTGRQLLILSCRPVDRDSFTVVVDEVTQVLADGDFAVYDAAQGLLFRKYTWPLLNVAPGNDGQAHIVLTYKAGWVLPEFVGTWTTVAAVTLGRWIRPSSPALSPLLFEVTTAGTAGVAEPTWPTTSGETVTDGTAVLTARDAIELPAILTLAAQITLKAWFGEDGSTPLDVPGNLAAERHGSVELTYASGPGSLASAIPVPAQSMLEIYR